MTCNFFGVQEQGRHPYFSSVFFSTIECREKGSGEWKWCTCGMMTSLGQSRLFTVNESCSMECIIAIWIPKRGEDRVVVAEKVFCVWLNMNFDFHFNY